MKRATITTIFLSVSRHSGSVENELSAQLGGVFDFQITLAPVRLLLGLVRAMSDLSDYAAMVIVVTGSRAASKTRRRARRYVLPLSATATTFSETQNELRLAATTSDVWCGAGRDIASL
jgi:hypothetical protein